MSTPRFRICPYGLNGWIIEKFYLKNEIISFKKNYRKAFFGLFSVYDGITELTEWDEVWRPVSIDKYGLLFEGNKVDFPNLVYKSKDAAKEAIDRYLEKHLELHDGLKKIAERIRTVLPEEYP